MKAPRPLTEGKRSGNIFAAAAGFFPVIRQRKPRGIIINAFCFDRAMFTPVATMLFQRQKLWYAKQAELQEVESLATEVLDWTVGVACANHDVQNAL
eukprot:3922525-Lingulodinium_polyedra.AAC.1